MPGPTSAIASGNQLFDILIYIPALLPPATITTATQTTTTTTVPGLAIGDFVSWNMLTLPNALISVTNMYVSAANTLTSTWSTEGATVNGAAAQPFLLEIIRATTIPYTQLPNGIY
jgi:hypothetical protein